MIYSETQLHDLYHQKSQKERCCHQKMQFSDTVFCLLLLLVMDLCFACCLMGAKYQSVGIQ